MNNQEQAGQRRFSSAQRAVDRPRREAWLHDVLASIVVFLVALPLCMGIAIASGVPVAAGLITGIVGGLVVGVLAGAPLQVSGPAAGLTVIVYELVQEHGLEVLGLAVFVGGALQLTAGLARCGRWFRAVSPAVIHGMLAGIGILIFSSQFHVMVDDSPRGSGLENLLSIPEAIRKGLPWPELGTVEERKIRSDLLRRFGRLHEQQVQLREWVAEQAPIESAAALHRPGEPTAPPLEQQAAAPGRGAATNPPGPWIDATLQQQRRLSEQLSALREQLRDQHVTEALHASGDLRRTVEEAWGASRAALEDLEQGRIADAHASQAAAQRRLEEVEATLKNHDWAAKIGLLTIVVLVAWKLVAPRHPRTAGDGGSTWLARLYRGLGFVPAPLLAVAVATAVASLLSLPVLYVEIPDNLWSEVHLPSMSVLQSVPWPILLRTGIVLAVVASAETLLCATAVDKMRPGMRTDYDRELAAQGAGNMLCGLLGALPMTGVIVRSSANVDAGAQTRLAAILHGVWLLLFVSALAFVLRMIPTAALAAMLVYTGYKLVDVRAVRQLHKYGWGEVGIYAATVVTIVAADLLTGVVAGMLLSAAKLLYTFSHLGVRLEDVPGTSKAVLHLEGAATFIRLPRLAEALEEVPGDVELHVDFEHLDYIDHACLDLLMSWAKQHESTGGTLVIDWDSLHASVHQEHRNRRRTPRRAAV